ncbi:glycosyltransferase family 39 protein [Spirosoma linguale]|uniref:4-amino-4-deoxy-L-arabinose transferase-like protein glycosyltransferase of PMT family n=1 Tax=Spirosoma linguale (strain ATCC 33905 / DSM 74 / LMG 10896 / Claus 1) TaxID=504472 RepID=D2QJ87_SPILD|nr:4-amino-4-deoxy-L-arabinose transferase-like protein glycosyltransferase of PMT family [Spirosoma linguale DSM 74]
MAKRSLILLGFIVAKFILQYWLVLPDYDLHRDEYLHLDQAHHLAWGYLSVPPFTSWIALLISWLGNSMVLVHFFPALFGALTILIVWKTVEELTDSLFACVLAVSCLLFSVLLRLNQLFQPNSLDVLCWTTLYFVLIKYIHSKQTRWLYILGIVFAVGFLNKYNVVFLLVGFLPALLLTEQRTVLRNRHMYGALLVGLLLMAPNLFWQYQHAFPVVHHMRLLAQTQLVHVNRADFLMEQILFFIGSWVVILGGLYGLLVYKPFEQYRSFFYALIFTLSAFLFLRAKGYYAIGIYPIYMAFGATFLAVKVKSIGVRAALVALPILFFIPLYQVAFPNQTPQAIAQHSERYKKWGLLRWEDGKDHALPQDFADMLGWRELATKVDTVYSRLADPQATLVLCDNYGQAGAINYYTRQGIKAVTFNADYIDWFDLTKKYKHLIRVKSAEGSADELKETSPFFTTAYVAASITSPFARERGTTIYVFQQAKVNITSRLAKEIAEERW